MSINWDYSIPWQYISVDYPFFLQSLRVRPSVRMLLTEIFTHFFNAVKVKRTATDFFYPCYLWNTTLLLKIFFTGFFFVEVCDRNLPRLSMIINWNKMSKGFVSVTSGIVVTCNHIQYFNCYFNLHYLQ